jgi:hypothetical protein
LGIWIGCGYKPGQDRVKGYLKDVVTSLKKSRCLQRLHIFWLNGHGVDSIASFNNNRTLVLGDRNLQVERRLNGLRRKTDRMSNNLSIFATDAERILSPLKELRGLRMATLRGSVSDEWALYLEGCMKLEEETVAKFEGENQPLG